MPDPYAVSLHRLAHLAGSCDCTTPPPDPADDRLALRLSMGRRAVERAKAAGIDLGQPTDDQIAELGDAEVEAYKELVLTRLRILNLAQRRAARDSDYRPPTPEEVVALTPEPSRLGPNRGVDRGPTHSVAGGQPRIRDRNAVYDRDDDNEDWRPIP